MKAQSARMLMILALLISPLLTACGGLSNKQKTAANEALAALKKTQAATQVGVSYQQYGLLVIEAKDKVNNAHALLPDGALKTEFDAAIEAYTDASAGWGTEIQNGYFLADSPLGQQLIQKYSIARTGVVFPSNPKPPSLWRKLTC